MTPQEITASLAAPRIVVVATISRNGRPRLTPNGYRYDGRVLTLITRADRLKYLNLQRNNRIPVCIGDPPVASNDVVISGTATCTEDDIWDEARRIIARYRGSTEVDDYLDDDCRLHGHCPLGRILVCPGEDAGGLRSGAADRLSPSRTGC
jgi:hypothetical protein